LPKLIAASIERGSSNRKQEFETEQMLPMTVETIACLGIAR
jgi:hypothetical protein